MMTRTGAERWQYDEWKEERSRIDRDRVDRQKNAAGQWTREWDTLKTPSVTL